MYEKNYSRSLDFPTSCAVLMRSVYAWMAGGLGITAIVALLTASSYELMYAIATTPALLWGLLIGEVVMVMVLAGRIGKMSYRTAVVMFLAYAALNGLTMSFIFLLYSSTLIAQTFFVTAGTFGAMSLVGYTTKKDLSTLGRTLYMLLFGVIIATVVNMFMQNSGFALVLNYLGVFIFVGLTAYDTQKIKNMLVGYDMAGIDDNVRKVALMGSLSLYLDFINLFLYLLRIFGNRK